MTDQELKLAAMQCLLKAFQGDTQTPVHVVQAAVSLVLCDFDPKKKAA